MRAQQSVKMVCGNDTNYGTRNEVIGEADESNPPATRAVRIPM